MEETGAVDQVCGKDAEPQGQDGARGGGLDKGIYAGEAEPKKDDGAIGDGEEGQEGDGKRAEQESEEEERGEVIGETAGVEAEAAGEVSAVKGVAADLAEVGAKEGAAVVIDDQAWVVPQGVA